MAQLSGASDRSTANVQIDTVGTTDWIHWVGNYLVSPVRKSGGGSIISDLSFVGGVVADGFNGGGDPSTLSWSGGAPTASGSDTALRYPVTTASGDGERITVAADTSVQVLYLFLGCSDNNVNVVATLSDGSASPITLTPTGTTNSDYNCQITFQAGSGGQTLTIDWIATSAVAVAPWWRGAALAPGSAPPADQPSPRRRRFEEPAEELPPRRRLLAPGAYADRPSRRTLRVEEVAEEFRRRRLFVPPPPVVVTAQPFARARRAQDDAPDEPRPRRHSDATAALDVPVTIPDLALWLRGDGARTSAGNVTSIDDWSGNGRDVTAVGTVPFLASSLNGKPGWRLPGVSVGLSNTASNLFASGDARTIFIVAKSSTEFGGPLLENQRTSGVRATYFQGGSGYGPFAGGLYTNSIDGARNASIAPGGIAGVPMILEFTAAAAPAFLAARINGVAQAITQGSPCDAETGAAGFAIGIWGAGAGAAYAGDMVEVLAFRRLLSAAEQLTVRAYLALRYLIGIDVPTWRSRQWMDAIRSSWDVEDVRARRQRAPILPAVTPDNPPPRASSARARMLADESRVEPDPRKRRPAYPLRGSISITSDTSTAAVDLTAIGTSDWKTFVGVTKPGDVIRKISGGSQISDWSLFSGGTPVWTPGFEPNVVQWSDGNPTLAGSHSGILSLTGDFATGFTFTVPADTNARTLHLYLGALNLGSALLEVSLSDGSAADSYTAVSADGEWNAHIAYQAASPGARLTVSFYVSSVGPCQVHVRGLALAGPAYVPDSIPFVRRLWQALASWDVEELRQRPRRAPILAAVTPDAPPPRAVRRREEEAEVITGRRNRKLVPQPAAVVNNPPPRAGRSNWRVAWESFEPVELLRKVYRLVFPGIDYPPPVPPLHIVENDVVRTIADTTSTRSIVETDTVREVSPMKTRKVGDTADVFSGTLYSGGAPRSLAGSSVKLYMWDSRTHALKINGAACLVEPSGTGTWSYQPIAADVDTAGEWEYDVEETMASGRLAVYPSSGYGKFVTEERVG